MHRKDLSALFVYAKETLKLQMCILVIPPLDSEGSRQPDPAQSAMGFRMIPPPLFGA